MTERKIPNEFENLTYVLPKLQLQIELKKIKHVAYFTLFTLFYFYTFTLVLHFFYF